MNILRETLVVALVCVVCAGGWMAVKGIPHPPEQDQLSCSAPVAAQPAIQWITQATAHALAENPDVMFADARDEDAFIRGHIAGAIHAPVENGTVDSRIVEMLRQAPTVIAYCDTSESCSRSSRLASVLGNAGLRDVRVLEGGIDAWLASGSPAEAGSCRTCPQ